MSQHFIKGIAKSGEPIEALCGYDRPLHRFFLSVQPSGVDIDDAEDEAKMALFLRKDLNFESMHTAHGGLLLHQIGEKLEEYNFDVPYGLLQVLEQDSVADQLAAHRGEVRNKRVHWPLEGAELQAHLGFMDKHIISSTLANDEDSSDDELVALLREQMQTLPFKTFVHRIVENERPKFFTNPMHSIDFNAFFKGVRKEQSNV